MKHKETLDDYEGCCGELVDQMMHWLGEKKIDILYIKPAAECDMALNDIWSYHMVSVIDGIVHDAWFPELLLPPEEYVKKAFWCGMPTLSIIL
jgi:hypothetical protein